jgi:hypothetical protein
VETTEGKDQVTEERQDNTQHFLQPKIIGYRQLSPNEAEMMNDVKRLAEQAGVMCDSLEGLRDIDPRWVAIARTQLQLGFMALSRSIAKPTSF